MKKNHRGTIFALCMALSLLLCIGAQADNSGYYRELLGADLIDSYAPIAHRSLRNTFIPLSDALSKLGYMGGGKPMTPYANNQAMDIPSRVREAMRMFSQYMRIPYDDAGDVSSLQQALLYSAYAQESPVPSFNVWNAKDLLADSIKSGEEVYMVGTLDNLSVSGDTYSFKFTVGKRQISVEYTRPARAPQLMAGDRVFIFGECTSTESFNYVVRASLVAFQDSTQTN